MGTFELDRERGFDRRLGNERIGRGPDNEFEGAAEETGPLLDRRRIRQECIIALKVYDHCRQPYCKIQLPA